MKATDIMIGDWVRNDLDEIQQVQEIRSDSENSVMLAYGDFYGFDEIEPVKLTSPILERNEFHEESTGRFIARGLDGLLIKWEVVIRKSAESMYLDIEAYSAEYNNFSGAGFLFVHELQHALRLCGIEKEIIL